VIRLKELHHVDNTAEDEGKVKPQETKAVSSLFLLGHVCCGKVVSAAEVEMANMQTITAKPAKARE